MKTMLIFSLLILTQFCSAQQRRALLVGVANYPEDSGWRKINSDNDVSLLDRVLSNSFSVKSIVDEQATRSNILKELTYLQKETSRGDTILVSFSCHGQQMIAQKSNEPDSLDEALIPYDARVKYSSDYHGENHLRDDDLSDCVSKIRAKAGSEGLVIVLLDACHSGDSFRDAEEMEHIRGGYHVFGPDPTVRNVQKELKNVVSVESTEGWSDVVFIGACQSYQLNAEYKDPNDKWYGSLTYAFAKAFKEDGLDNIASLCLDIKSYVESFNKSTRQCPEFATTINSICEIENVWGVITDANTGEEIIGASVKVNGTTTATVSDTMGKYTIVANPGQTLEISYNGYISQSVLVGNQKQINIKLQMKSNERDVLLCGIIAVLVLVAFSLIALYLWKKK